MSLLHVQPNTRIPLALSWQSNARGTLAFFRALFGGWWQILDRFTRMLKPVELSPLFFEVVIIWTVTSRITPDFLQTEE